MATGPNPLIRHLIEQTMRQQGMSGMPFGARETISSTPLAPTQTPAPIALGPGNQPAAALPRQASPWSTGTQPIPQRPAPSPREAWGRGVQRGPRATAARAGASRPVAGPANPGPAAPINPRAGATGGLPIHGPAAPLTAAQQARQIPFRQSAVTDTWGRPSVSPSGSLPPPPSGPLHGPFRPPPSPAPSRLPGPHFGGFRGVLGNVLVSQGGRMAADQAFAGKDMNSPLGNILESTAIPATSTGIANPMLGVATGLGGGLAAGHTALDDLADEGGVVNRLGSAYGQSAIQGIPLVGPGASAVGRALSAADVGSIPDAINKYVPDDGLAGWLKGMAGFGPSEVGSDGEEAVDPVAEQRARAASPDAMLGVLTASGLDGTQATEVLRTYEQEVQRNIALNSVGALGLGKDEKGNIYPSSDAPEGTELTPLTDEDIRHMTAMDVYASIPEIMAEEERRLEGLQRAAVFQAMLGSTISPMNLANDQTNAQFQAAGDPLGALLSQNAHQARSAALMALPMTLAIDEQAEWDRRIAAIQQQQLMNQYLNPQEDQSVNPDEELFG